MKLQNYFFLIIFGLGFWSSCSGQENVVTAKDLRLYQITSTSSKIRAILKDFIRSENQCLDYKENLVVALFHFDNHIGDTNGIVVSVEPFNEAMKKEWGGYVIVDSTIVFLETEVLTLPFFTRTEESQSFSYPYLHIDIPYLTKGADTLHLVYGQGKPYLARWFLQYYDLEVNIFRQDRCELQEKVEMIDSLINSGWNYPEFEK